MGGEGEGGERSVSLRATVSTGVGRVDFRMPFNGRLVADADDLSDTGRVSDVSGGGV